MVGQRDLLFWCVHITSLSPWKCDERAGRWKKLERERTGRGKGFNVKKGGKNNSKALEQRARNQAKSWTVSLKFNFLAQTFITVHTSVGSSQSWRCVHSKVRVMQMQVQNWTQSKWKSATQLLCYLISPLSYSAMRKALAWHGLLVYPPLRVGGSQGSALAVALWSHSCCGVGAL